MRGNGRTLQGYNAQAAATMEQVVVAAELTQQANDVQRLAADSGSWSIANVSAIPDAPQLLIPRPVMAGTASPARTADHQSPRATG